MRLFMNGFLTFLFVMCLVTAQSCGKKNDKKEEPVEAPVDVPLEPTCNHNPDAPGPQPAPIPEEPTPEPAPEPEPVPAPVPEPEPVPVPEPTPVPLDPSKTFKVNVVFYGSLATSTRVAKYRRAMCVLKEVVGTSDFKSKILNYDSPYTVNKFYDTTKTNSQVYQHILDGNEVLQPTKDNELDVEVQFYYENSSVIGYTNRSTKRIYVNTKFFDTYTPRSVAGNLMHEWLHKLGYGHSVSYTVMRPHSVPYAIGYMVTSMGKTKEAICP